MKRDWDYFFGTVLKAGGLLIWCYLVWKNDYISQQISLFLRFLSVLFVLLMLYALKNSFGQKIEEKTYTKTSLSFFQKIYHLFVKCGKIDILFVPLYTSAVIVFAPNLPILIVSISMAFLALWLNWYRIQDFERYL